VRWALPDSFRDLSKELRRALTRQFCEEQLAPVLARLDPDRPHYYGQDFARSGDASDIIVAAQERTLVRSTQILIELRNVPFETQRDVLFFALDRLPRFAGGASDATGNGAYLAEVARQRYGERVLEVKFSAEWYRQNAVPYIEAFADRTILLPRHEDVLRDHQALAYVNGVVKVPDDFRFKGSDGFDRHGDSAIAGMLMWYASVQGAVEYDYRGAADPRRSVPNPGRMQDVFDEDGADRRQRDWWDPPLGAGLRGGIF
jgi:phage FluMu gp28-like protein